MSRLACVIPVVGSVEGLETTLISVLERRPDSCDVVVVFDTPYDDPYSLQGEVQFLHAPPGAGFVACANLGIRATDAPVVHIIGAGLEATEGWIDTALRHFEDPQVASVTPAIFDSSEPNNMLMSGVAYSRGGRKRRTAEGNDSIVGPWGRAAFFRRTALQSLNGGFDAAVGDNLADIDLAVSLREAGWLNKVESGSRILAKSIAEQPQSAFASGLFNERLFWRTLWGIKSTASLGCSWYQFD